MNKTFCHIKKSLGQLDQVAAYLGLTGEDLLVNNEISEELSALEDTSPHSFREVILCSHFMKLPEDDRQLVEALVQRLSPKKISSGV